MYSEKLVLDNMNLARFVAKKYMNTGIEYDDLQQMAFEGLVRAAARFDVSKGYAFSTYACRCIENGIKRYFEKKRISAESLDEPIKENLSLSDFVEDGVDLFDEIETKEVIANAMNVLNDKERFVVNSFYLKEPHVKRVEIAKALNVCPQRVSQILRSALKKIRENVS